jgi:hypothetical protein
MKKAKEYAIDILDTYIKTDQETAIRLAAGIVKELFNEVIELQKLRKVGTVGPLYAIFKEQHIKWVAICNRVNKEIPLLNEWAFVQNIEAHMTMVYPSLIRLYPELNPSPQLH